MQTLKPELAYAHSWPDSTEPDRPPFTGPISGGQAKRLGQETTYAYDALNRLTEFNPPGEGTTGYDYDKAGNRTEAGGTTYSYNALNQLTEASTGTTYSYDGAGRMTGEINGSEKTSYEWDLFDHLAKVEGPTETTSYAYDGLERLSERKSGTSTQVTHYGDLSDLPTYVANGEGKTTTSYVQGAHGLVEQRAAEATSYPLADGHGDITALTGPAGGIESRQEYGPWGEQLSGPELEMGYLGALERPTDPTTGLIQMGARSYDPSLGSFASEDPVPGHLGVGASADRYLYVWDNPVNRYDLNGRDVCVPTPFGSACAEEGAEDVGGAASRVWNLTQPVRHFAANRAQDFVKTVEKAVSNFEEGESQLGETTRNSERGRGGMWNAHGRPSPNRASIKSAFRNFISTSQKNLSTSLRSSSRLHLCHEYE